MNILIVSQYFWPEEFKINDLVRELKVKKYKITILTSNPSYPDKKLFNDYYINKKKYLSFSNNKIIRVPVISRSNNKLKLFLNYLSFVISASTIGLWRIRKERYDLIFVFQTSPPTVIIPALIIKKIKNSKMIIWILDLWPETIVGMGFLKNKTLIKIFDKVLNRLYSAGDIIFCQSEYMKKTIIEKFKNQKIPYENIKYLPVWAESLFAQHIKVTKKNEIINHNFLKILFAGNIGDAQDFNIILKAAVNLKEEKIMWHIVGAGSKYEWLKKEIKLLNLESTVFLLGKQPIEKMPKFYEWADVFLVTLKQSISNSITIPGKIQSYLLSGKPILAALNGAASEVIKESGSGLVSPAENSDDFIKNVLEMSKMSYEQKKLMGNNGIKYSTNNFNKEKIINKFEGVIEETLNLVNINGKN